MNNNSQRVLQSQPG
ncbi:hypothetical protein, partial [Escherichia coli]